MQVYDSDNLPTFADWKTSRSAKTARQALIAPPNHFGVVDIVVADVGSVTPNGDLSGAESLKRVVDTNSARRRAR